MESDLRSGLCVEGMIGMFMLVVRRGRRECRVDDVSCLEEELTSNRIANENDWLWAHTGSNILLLIVIHHATCI